jgi:hypothetical protein
MGRFCGARKSFFYLIFWIAILAEPIDLQGEISRAQSNEAITIPIGTIGIPCVKENRFSGLNYFKWVLLSVARPRWPAAHARFSTAGAIYGKLAARLAQRPAHITCRKKYSSKPSAAR